MSHNFGEFNYNYSRLIDDSTTRLIGLHYSFKYPLLQNQMIQLNEMSYRIKCHNENKAYRFFNKVPFFSDFLSEELICHSRHKWQIAKQ